MNDETLTAREKKLKREAKYVDHALAKDFVKKFNKLKYAPLNVSGEQMSEVAWVFVVDGQPFTAFIQRGDMISDDLGTAIQS